MSFIAGRRCPNTVLLAGFNDWVDQSGHGRVLTAGGSAALGTTVADPWGGSRNVLELNGSTDYADYGSPLVTTNDLTVPMTCEFWVRFDTVTTASFITHRAGNPASIGDFVVRYTGGSLWGWRWYDNSSRVRYATLAWTPSVDTWYHISFNWKADGGIFLAVDGTGATQGSPPSTTSGGVLQYNIGRRDTEALNGYMADVMVLDGVALRTANFDAPSYPLTNWEWRV